MQRKKGPKCSRQVSMAPTYPKPCAPHQTEELIHSGNEVRGGCRSRYATGKNPLERNGVTIHSLRVRAVLMDNVAVQVDPGKEPSAAQ